jgi:hypothetical protein
MGIIGIIGVLVISLVVLFSHTPDTSVPFPYVPPPEGPEGYYLEATTDQLTSALTRDYYALDPVRYKGESFIFKNVVIKERRLVDTYLIVGLIQFQTQDPSDLKEFKEGYVVDIIGVCGGALEEGSPVIVFRNCQLLPAGVAPLPLPGGPAIVDGY